MNIDIWSDIRCPFCYIGKKNFEEALSKFPDKKQVKVTWHSFQLDPQLQTQPEANAREHFIKTKGISAEDAQGMFQHVEQVGKQAGINFDLANQKVANSYRAHLLLQLASSKNKADLVEELLFRAQLTDSKNIDDENNLIEIGQEAGFSETEIKAALESEIFAAGVSRDMLLASQMGINSVPFFVVNDKYGVSGAQPANVFQEVLEKSWKEYKEGDHGLNILHEGKSCDTDGNCD